jgi:peptide/nickel transport system permease protein
MLRYVASRLLTVMPTLFVVSVVVFGLQQMLPGESLDPAIIAQIRADRHLDQTILVQYTLWLAGVLHGDLGQSLRNNVPVAQLISEKLPATAILSAMAMGWAVLIGVPARIVSALHRGRGLDYLANVIGLAGLSVPPNSACCRHPAISVR